MINTIQTKSGQLAKGSFTIGSGPETLLLMGSCRSVPYVNYFDYLQSSRFTVHFIDPFNWHWDENNMPVDYEKKINELESNAYLLDLFKKTKWFIHEYYENFGLFNTNKTRPKNIYQFGLKPEHDVCIPNFNDRFILFQDVVRFNSDIKSRVKAELEKSKELSPELVALIKGKGLEALEGFCQICPLTSFPEMELLFRHTWKTVRYWHTMNHVTNQFTIAIFWLLNEKFLKLDASPEFWEKIQCEDLFSAIQTPVTRYDVSEYGIKWPGAIQELTA